MNYYEQLKELGCSNPAQCLREVTKFYDHNYNEVTVRLPLKRRTFHNAN